MTEIENTKDHRAPLAPGEIRAHRVGDQIFRVMHVAGGNFTQASVSGNGMATRVLATERFESDAVRAYADAIECAEADALDDADDTQYISPASGELVVPQNTSPDHRRPLAPGEMRHHEIGNRTYRVMHVAGGSFTQASVHAKGEPTRVLATERFASDAVRAYADAIDAAEADEADEADELPYQPGHPLADRELLRIEQNHVTESWPTLSPVLHAQMLGRTLRTERPSEPSQRHGREVLGAPIEIDVAPVAKVTSLPSLAEDVAWLRKNAHVDGPRYQLTERLDRIAAQVPVRATDDDGWPLYRSPCGDVRGWYGDRPTDDRLYCQLCDGSHSMSTEWQALYTLGGAA